MLRQEDCDILCMEPCYYQATNKLIYYRIILNIKYTDFRKKQPEIYYHNKIVTSGCFLTIDYSAEIAPKPQEFRQVPQSTQTLASIA